MGRGTGRRGRGRGKRGRPQKGRGHKPSPTYIGKYKKKGRNSKKTRNNYDETLLERAQNDFNLKAGAISNPDKKKLNEILREVCRAYVYEEDYKNFRLAVRRRLDCFSNQQYFPM